MITRFPFQPKPRLVGEEVSKELFDNIEYVARVNKLNINELSASFELLSSEDGHYFVSEVIHTPREKSIKKSRSKLRK